MRFFLFHAPDTVQFIELPSRAEFDGLLRQLNATIPASSKEIPERCVIKLYGRVVWEACQAREWPQDRKLPQ